MKFHTPLTPSAQSLARAAAWQAQKRQSWLCALAVQRVKTNSGTLFASKNYMKQILIGIWEKKPNTNLRNDDFSCRKKN